jgi:ABC-type uncharacterized transport system substrate-binding protein
VDELPCRVPAAPETASMSVLSEEGMLAIRATKVELIINLKAAKALGINVPLSILGRADEVIE